MDADFELLRAENERLRGRVADLERTIDHLQATVERLTAANERLTAALDEARRAGKRQAAPFRKPGGPKPEPKKPGRKPGDAHGPHAHRAAPRPKAIDETHEAPLPCACPNCGGRQFDDEHMAVQYQTEIPRRPVVRQFNIHVARCRQCGRAVQGRHELQTSDATGAAASQLGADAHAALALLNKQCGLSHGKCRDVMQQLFGIHIARATSARSILRTSARCGAAYDQLRIDVRNSPRVVPDETGWCVGGKTAWLHAFASARATCYEVDPTRSHEPAERLLGRDWHGAMTHDGWSIYDRFHSAMHQQCTAHLLRRCNALLETATGIAARFPQRVKNILQHGLRLRDRFAAREMTPHGLYVMAGRLRSQMESLVTPVKRHAANERFAKFLETHLDELFTYLRRPEIDATNWRGEQAIRPAVVNRKVWGGNRTWCGAAAQSTLMSVLRTLAQRSHAALDWLATALRRPTPLLIPP
jgi:transposase